MADYFDADLQGSRFERVDLSGSEFCTIDLTGHEDLRRRNRAVRIDPRGY